MIFSGLSQYLSFFTQYQILDALRPKSGGVLGNLLQPATYGPFKYFMVFKDRDILLEGFYSRRILESVQRIVR